MATIAVASAFTSPPSPSRRRARRRWCTSRSHRRLHRDGTARTRTHRPLQGKLTKRSGAPLRSLAPATRRRTASLPAGSAALHRRAKSTQLTLVRGVRCAARRGGKQAHVRDVGGILRTPPLVSATRLRANQRVGSADAFGLVEHVETVPIDDPVDVPAQLLPQGEPQRGLHRVGAEGAQAAATGAATGEPCATDRPLRFETSRARTDSPGGRARRPDGAARPPP